MKIPANNQVIFIKNVIAVAAYRSCRLWRWVKMSWIHVLYNHHWTQCQHALSNTSHVAQKRILEHPGRPPKCRWQDVSQVEPPDSCTPMKLGPHALSHGRTNDQLECRFPWQSPRSIGLRGSSWYLWSCSSSVWTYADCPPPPPPPPPRFFQRPVCRASTV